ncbi:hypothetical protein [Rubrobacter indicoceani]|uniref:hypothetical protein n=1 Tax=Rubrobacter indicoceani TaxID=2051957 RepID=UPI000E5B66CC|nr:hypothetical protein [Rubrobacter indicoceani]
MANSDAIQVRKVTDLHANYSVQGEYEAGKFSLQLILDNGAKEMVVLPTAPDTKVLVKLFNSGETIYFDTERGALVFNNV